MQSERSEFSLNDAKGYSGVLLLGVLLLLTVGGWYIFNDNLGMSTVFPFLRSGTVDTVSQPTLMVPSDAVKLSGCVPGMGNHWARLEDLPGGPLYVEYEGKVLGVEYMFEVEDIPGEKVARMPIGELFGYLSSNGLTIIDLVNDHLSFNLPNVPFSQVQVHWVAPHAGLTVPHIDMHLYLPGVDHEYLQTVCPDNTFEEIITPELIQELLEAGVELPAP